MRGTLMIACCLAALAAGSVLGGQGAQVAHRGHGHRAGLSASQKSTKLHTKKHHKHVRKHTKAGAHIRSHGSATRAAPVL